MTFAQGGLTPQGLKRLRSLATRSSEEAAEFLSLAGNAEKAGDVTRHSSRVTWRRMRRQASFRSVSAVSRLSGCRPCTRSMGNEAVREVFLSFVLRFAS